MPKKNPAEEWPVKQWRTIERDWDKWENPIQILFVVDGIIISLFFGYLVSGGKTMNALIGYIFAIFLWAFILSAILLIRNTGKVTKQKLDSMDKKLDKLDETNQLLRDLLKRIDERWPKP